MSEPARDGLLRPALEAALVVARVGQMADPPLAAPVSLRPFLQFARVPGRALAPARNVLDADAEFRARVAAVVSEDDVGRAGWIFLTRPDGWEAELAGLEEAQQAAGAADAEAREERVARKRMPKLEEALRRAESERDRARAAATAAEARLGEERRSRREAEAAAESLREALATATQRLETAEAAATEDRARAGSLEADVRRLESELAAVAGALAAAEGTAESAAAEAAAAREVAARHEESALGGRPLDRDRLGRAIAEAGTAAARLGRALADAAGVVGAPDAGGPGDPGEATGEAAAPQPHVVPAPAQGPSRRPSSPRRVPLTLPPAVYDDSDEAADFLLRRGGVVLVVDGYNASHALWTGLPPAEQRRRLVDALAGLAVRTGADVEVVWDGSELAGPQTVPSVGRRPVKESFSPPGVKADPIVIERVASLPVVRPVVVASSDREVRDGARDHGANVISSVQLAHQLHAPKP